jgi:hypothetical protein
MSLFGNVDFVQISFDPGHRVEGSWVEGEKHETAFKGTWQPASGQALQLLPEGKRNREVYKVFAPIALTFTAADDDKGTSGDRVIYQGKEYEVSAAAKWDNGLIPHWELLCTRPPAEKAGTT